MSEQVIDLGAGRFGLLHTAGTARRDTAVLLLNAGMIHRMGPFRLYVDLARRLAQAGYACLRWDSPGIGDTLSLGEQSPAVQLREVFDRLQAATGCQRFVLGGICSAADFAWRAALADTRVVGVLSLDGFARGGPWYRLGQLQLLWRRSPARWWQLVRQRLFVRRDAGTTAQVADYRDWPAAGCEQTELQQLLTRDLRLFALYTGGAANYLLHRNQFFTTFGAAARDPRIVLQHWPECDHLFFDPADRDRLAEAFSRWMQHEFPGAAHA